ncbi:MAG: LysM peptidoglycan-binding domain-containing protein [Ardenticatenaceae bacterium]|nr:LysM peptidoglycan-binding domain-containing protein [Ardenticatenaceae bacterium]
MKRSNCTLHLLFSLLLIFLFLLTPTIALADTTHTVAPGETLYSISRRYGVSIQDILAANNIANPNLIFVGQEIIIPDVDTPAPTQPTPTNPPPGETVVHTVRTGDTLNKIASQYGTTVSAIAQANGLINRNLIFIGQQLTIPGATSPAPTTPPPSNPPPEPTTPPPAGTSSYTVSRGDTLSKIAVRFGTTVNAIMAANGLSNPNLIYVGQVLQIPGGGGSSPTPTNPVTGPITLSGLAFGGQTQTFANTGLMQDIGMTWVKVQFKWSPGNSAGDVAGVINQAKGAGFKVLVSMPGATTYPSSIDFDAYVRFLGEVAALPTPPDAMEVWNEQNIDFEWPAGEISPTDYVNRMLAPGYNAIKNANSNILVISGAPAPTGFDNTTNAWADDRYIRGMAAAGAANYADCIGIHFNAGATSPNSSTGHPAGTHYSWYFNPMVNTYSNAFGSSRPLCFTEIGFLSGDGFNGLPPNFAWASGTSVQEHAQWLGEALQRSSIDSRITMFIIYNVDFTLYQSDGDPQAGYAIVRPDGSCPACDTIKGVLGR